MVLILALIGTVITSCSNADEPLPEPTPNDEGVSYEVSLSLGGEYTNVTEEPLSRADETPKKYYGINVYCMKTDGTENSYGHYAYGVFDNVADMKITLLGGYKYKFECTSATEGDDKFFDSSSYILYPFQTSYKYTSTINGTKYDYYYFGKNYINKFITSQSEYLAGIKYGQTAYQSESSYNVYYSPYTRSYPRTDRYYGEITDFIPSNGGVANIPMKRTIFGVKMVINGVPDGKLDWSISLPMEHTSYNSSESLSFSHIYTFSYVKDCWINDSYSSDFTINFMWLRSNGYWQNFNERITVKRNVMTTVNVNLKGGANDISLGIEEDDTPMGNEGVNVDYDGGDLNDTPVNPQE